MSDLLNSAVCNLDTTAENENVSKATIQKNTERYKSQSRDAIASKQDAPESELSASDSDGEPVSNDSADSEMIGGPRSVHASVEPTRTYKSARENDSSSVGLANKSTFKHCGDEQTKRTVKIGTKHASISSPDIQEECSTQKLNNFDKSDEAENPVHPGSSIQKQIAEYFSLHRAEVNDPSLLNVGGMWSLNMQFAQMRSMLSSVKVDVSHLKSKLDAINAVGAGNANSNRMDDDEAELGFKNRLSLPWDTMDQFEDFDQDLTQNRKLQKQVKDYCKQLVTKDLGATRAMGIILRAYMTQELAQKFTTKKKMPNKSVFSNTAFYKCLEDFAIQYWKDGAISTLSSIQFQNSIKSVLNNVKDWNGNRNARLQAAIAKKKDINEVESEINNKNPSDSEETH